MGIFLDTSGFSSETNAGVLKKHNRPLTGLIVFWENLPKSLLAILANRHILSNSCIRPPTFALLRIRAEFPLIL